MSTDVLMTAGAPNSPFFKQADFYNNYILDPRDPLNTLYSYLGPYGYKYPNAIDNTTITGDDVENVTYIVCPGNISSCPSGYSTGTGSAYNKCGCLFTDLSKALMSCIALNGENTDYYSMSGQPICLGVLQSEYVLNNGILMPIYQPYTMLPVYNDSSTSLGSAWQINPGYLEFGTSSPNNSAISQGQIAAAQVMANNYAQWVTNALADPTNTYMSACNPAIQDCSCYAPPCNTSLKNLLANSQAYSKYMLPYSYTVPGGNYLPFGMVNGNSNNLYNNTSWNFNAKDLSMGSIPFNDNYEYYLLAKNNQPFPNNDFSGGEYLLSLSGGKYYINEHYDPYTGIPDTWGGAALGIAYGAQCPAPWNWTPSGTCIPPALYNMEQIQQQGNSCQDYSFSDFNYNAYMSDNTQCCGLNANSATGGLPGLLEYSLPWLSGFFDSGGNSKNFPTNPPQLGGIWSCGCPNNQQFCINMTAGDQQCGCNPYQDNLCSPANFMCMNGYSYNSETCGCSCPYSIQYNSTTGTYACVK